MMRAALALLLLAAPATAEVTASGLNGFTSQSEAVLTQPPAQVFAAITQWSRWWDPAHSYSGQAGAMVLDTKSGGALLESWPGGNVQHAVVVAVMPPSLLRLTGGFGPLQGLPVAAVMDFALKPEGEGTRLVMIYKVAGPASAGLDRLAGPVDGVMAAGFARLLRYTRTGTVEEKR